MVGYLFCSATALSIYRRAGGRVASLPREDVALAEVGCDLRRLSPSLRTWLNREPIHLAVGPTGNHRRTKRLVTHNVGTRYQTVPAIKLGTDLYVCTPELLFVQMASVLSEIELAFLGCELCGAYGFSAEGKLCSRPQLTDVGRIEEYLCQHPGMHGRKKALWAVRHAVNSCASPMEAELVLRLSLPARMGGYGIVKPQVNTPINLGGAAQKAFGFPYITPDLFWEEARLALEYDSDEEHVGADTIARDARRRLALQAEGVRVITVTNEQMKSLADFDALAREVARLTGKRVRGDDVAVHQRRASLWREVHRCATHPEFLLRG